jgi:DNA mismatch repair protein MutL
MSVAPIQVLDPHLAAKIAAGEVIERPASVVKELVENALDAGARSIRVELEAGGTERILVADDGHGMPADQVELAFRRHATSKLRAEADLNNLKSLGFRGEALPSIAAVADITCTTRTAAERVGTELQIQGGAIEQRACSRQVGTSMLVEGLFARFPARRKFLRAQGAEGAACVQAVVPLALAFPQVQFNVEVDGREALLTPGDGDLLSAMLAILGPDAAEHLLSMPETHLSGEDGARVVSVDGVCASGGLSRAGRPAVYVLVNTRPVSNRSLTFAVVEAYGSLLQVGRQPVAVVRVRVPPDEVDFNVHPSKLEVKLLRERAVYATIQRALRAALASTAWPVPAWSDEESSSPQLTERLADLRVLGQAGRAYVIAEGEAGVYLVDQHAAHERVLLEELRAALAGRSERQLLLEPLVLDVPAPALGLLDELTPELARLGFDVELFGPRQLLVRAVPGLLAQRGREPERLLSESLAAAAGGSASHGLVFGPHASWAERLALILACKTAVRAGDVLAEPEMQALLRRLGEAELCRTCAHGRPTAIVLSHAQLEKQFGRK